MAGIGLYGVFYKPCEKEDGVVTGYTGNVAMMGKAVSVSFEPNTPDDNPLYANNGVAENDSSSGSGGTLTQTLDRLTLETASALFGTQVGKVQVQVGASSADGTEIVYKGSEQSVPVGVAYIKMQQEDGVRSHEVVFYREAIFSRPTDEAETMGEKIEWKTPEIEGVVSGLQGDGSEPWYRLSRWLTQEAAIAYIYSLFGETVSPAQLLSTQAALNDEVSV